MKRFFALLLAVLMLLSLAACAPATDKKDGKAEESKTEESKAEESKDEESKAEENKTEESKAEEAAPVEGTVHVFYYDFSDAYISKVRASMDESLKNAGIKFQNYDGAASQTTQNEQIQQALTGDCAMIIVNIVETAAEDAAMNIANQAKEKGIPCVFFNREITDAVVKSYDKCAFVGTRPEEAGIMQGKMIGDYLLANFEKVDLNGDGEISYVLFKGQQGNAEAEFRTQYAVEDANKILKEAGKKELAFYDANNADKFLVDQGGKWSAAAATDYMTNLLSQYNDANKNMVELVIANNDEMAKGAISALQTVGYNNGEDKVIPVFGVDAIEDAVVLIKEGKMVGSIKQDAVGMATNLTQVAQNLLAGKAFDEGITAPVDEGVAKVRVPYVPYTGE